MFPSLQSIFAYGIINFRACVFGQNLEIIKDYCLNLPLSLDNSEINIKTVAKESDGNSAICYQWEDGQFNQ